MSHTKALPSAFLNLMPCVQGMTNEYPPLSAVRQENEATCPEFIDAELLLFTVKY